MIMVGSNQISSASCTCTDQYIEDVCCFSINVVQPENTWYSWL